jgi:hypothetical protein
MASPGEAYVLLGLRLGRHADGLVDSYYGPPELKAQADAGPSAEPAALVAEADALLARLEDGWLRDQALGLRTYAGVLAGEELSYADEAERSYGIRPYRQDTAVYEAAHERLAELLPGDGSVTERHRVWHEANVVAPELVVPALRDVIAELREATSRLVALPEGEGLAAEPVYDEPWWAFNYYLGGLRSRVVVNLDLPTTCHDIVHLAGHEVYPGHHTERVVKEQLLFRAKGLVEESIQMVPTPAAVVSEGIAESGFGLVIDGEVAGRLVAALRRHGLDYDIELAAAVAEARRPLRLAGIDAALMIFEDGASAEDAEAYVRRWALHNPEEAAHTVRFVTDPTWRTYAVTYVAGRNLCESWVDGDPARFRRLLTEHVRVRDLLADGV